MQLFTLHRGVRRQRHGATAAHRTADCTLSGHRQPRGVVRQRGQGLLHIAAVRAGFNAQGPLPCSGQHLLGLKDMPNPRLQTQTLQARGGQHNAGILAFIEFAQAGVQIAPQWLNAQIGAQRTQQHGAAQTRCAHHRAGGQVFQAGKLRRDPSIARIFALHHAGQGKAFGHVHGHVFERMHGQVSAPFLQSDLQLFDKQTLATHFAE